MGFETEMRGIPEKYKKEVNDLIWKLHIVYFKYIISQKRLKKKWISIKFDLRVTKYAFI
jgi:hypothetical protein